MSHPIKNPSHKSNKLCLCSPKITTHKSQNEISKNMQQQILQSTIAVLDQRGQVGAVVISNF
jgi:hypothetical protein